MIFFLTCSKTYYKVIYFENALHRFNEKNQNKIKQNQTKQIQKQNQEKFQLKVLQENAFHVWHHAEVSKK